MQKNQSEEKLRRIGKTGKEKRKTSAEKKVTRRIERVLKERQKRRKRRRKRISVLEGNTREPLGLRTIHIYRSTGVCLADI